jgi:hypothetical protein
VLEVDSVGNHRKESHKIVKCTKTEGEVTTVLLEEGTEMVASGSGKTTNFAVDGAPVSDEAAEILSEVISLIEDETTDDDAFGTTGAVSVGQSWPVNAELIARKFGENQATTVKPEDVTGSVTLNAVSEHAGAACLELSGEMKVRAASAATGGVICRVAMEFSGIFPVDATLPRLEETRKATVEILAKEGDDPEAAETVMAWTSRSRSARYSTRGGAD